MVDKTALRLDSWSVIIPVRNETAALPGLLAQLAPLQAAGADCLFVDGQSRDDTEQQLRAAGQRVIKTAPGRARQMNAGVAQARGDWLWFLHADSQLPAHILTLLDEIQSGPPVWGRFDIRLNGHDWRLRVVEQLMNWRSRLTGIATGDQAIFIHRDLYQQVGGYADIPLMEDIQISKQLKAVQPPVCIPTALVTSARRWQQHGVMHTVALMWWLRWRYWLGADPHQLVQDYYHDL